MAGAIYNSSALKLRSFGPSQALCLFEVGEPVLKFKSGPLVGVCLARKAVHPSPTTLLAQPIGGCPGDLGPVTFGKIEGGGSKQMGGIGHSHRGFLKAVIEGGYSGHSTSAYPQRKTKMRQKRNDQSRGRPNLVFQRSR